MLAAQLILLVLCLGLEALFAGMEIGVISLNRIRLRHMLREGKRGARELDFFLRNPERLLGTTLVGTNLCMVVASVLAASIAVRLVGEAGAWISSLVMTVVVLIFAEYLPKSWFQANPAMRARHWAPLLRLFGVVLYPLGYTAIMATKLLFRLKGDPYQDAAHAITRDDLTHLALETERTGALSMREREMIHGVFGLERKTCRDIMTPLDQVVRVSASLSWREFHELVREKGHNRYPVYRGSANRIVGIVNILDAATDPAKGHRPVADYMRPPQFVPGNISPDKLLLRMRLTRQPIAMVTDENGRLIGLVTLEDVLEEIVGHAPPASAKTPGAGPAGHEPQFDVVMPARKG